MEDSTNAAKWELGEALRDVLHRATHLCEGETLCAISEAIAAVESEIGDDTGDDVIAEVEIEKRRSALERRWKDDRFIEED